MTEAAKKFKKHYRYAMKLKEGGKAWEREMKICEECLKTVLIKAEKEREQKIWNELLRKGTLNEIH